MCNITCCRRVDDNDIDVGNDDRKWARSDPGAGFPVTGPVPQLSDAVELVAQNFLESPAPSCKIIFLESWFPWL